MTRSVTNGGFALVVGGVALVGLVAGAGAVTLAARHAPLVEAGSQVAPSATDTPTHAPISVTLVRPRTSPFEESVDLLAVVSPKTLTSVHFLVPGKVEACFVKVGDAVALGAPLCRLDTSVVKLERDRAQAGVANADRALDSDFLARQRKLYESGVIGQGDYERVRVEAERAASLRDDARTALALADKKWELHGLRAPFRGRVVDVRARAGLPISPEIPAVLLSSLDGVVLKGEVPAKQWSRVAVGTAFTLTSVASVALPSESGVGAGEGTVEGPGEKYGRPRFTVTSKAPSVAPEKQTFEIELAPSGAQGSVPLAPGMLVSGSLVVARHEKGLALPVEALVSWDSATGEGEVFLRNAGTGKVELVKVRTTPPTGGFVHVLTGLDPQATVVSPVPPNLTEGDVVEGAK